MRIFDLFKMSPSLHSKCVFLYGYEYTYCQTCARRDSRVCHKLCKWHDKPYWKIREIQKVIDESAMSRKEKEMKYKEGYKEGVAVGDKFIIEIISIDKNSNYPYETVSGNRFNDDELSMMPQANGITEYYYNKGVEDAWKLMKRINEPRTMPENLEMFRALGVSEFCQVFELLTPQEAKTKFEAWKKAKEEIKAGDIVYANKDKNFNAIVLGVTGEVCHLLWFDGSCGKWDKSDLTKTGENHADKVSDIISCISK